VPSFGNTVDTFPVPSAAPTQEMSSPLEPIHLTEPWYSLICTGVKKVEGKLGKQKYLGRYATAEEANKVYQQALKELNDH